MNREQAQKFFDEHKIRYVLAQFVDIHGAAKAKAVPVEHLDMVLTDGALSQLNFETLIVPGGTSGSATAKSAGGQSHYWIDGGACRCV